MVAAEGVTAPIAQAGGGNMFYSLFTVFAFSILRALRLRTQNHNLLNLTRKFFPPDSADIVEQVHAFGVYIFQHRLISFTF